MGIYDRDYYRKEGPSYLDSFIPSGQVCKWLIIINVVVFIVQVWSNSLAERKLRDALARQGLEDVAPEVMRLVDPTKADPTFTDYFNIQPQKVMHGEVWRLLTYAFLHDPHGITHIFFNMLFLWWFGSELERMYGSREFLAFYLTAALVGGLAYVGFYLATHSGIPGLGASGAVTALLVLFACHFPSASIMVFFLIRVPIWLFVLFQIAQDSFGLMQGLMTLNANAGTVHLAGAAFGFLYFKMQWHILGLLQPLRSWKWKLPRARPSLRLYRPEESEAVPVSTVAPNSQLDEHLEAKLDAVLEKVARFGQSSLTDAERQILLKASEIYKRKRT